MQTDLGKFKVHLSTWHVRLFWNNHPVTNGYCPTIHPWNEMWQKNLVPSNLIPMVKGCQGILSFVPAPLSPSSLKNTWVVGAQVLCHFGLEPSNICCAGRCYAKNTRVKMVDWNVVNIILFCFKSNQHCWWGTPTNKPKKIIADVLQFKATHHRGLSCKCPQTVESQIKRHPRRLT